MTYSTRKFLFPYYLMKGGVYMLKDENESVQNKSGDDVPFIPIPPVNPLDPMPMPIPLVPDTTPDDDIAE